MARPAAATINEFVSCWACQKNGIKSRSLDVITAPKLREGMCACKHMQRVRCLSMALDLQIIR